MYFKGETKDFWHGGLGPGDAHSASCETARHTVRCGDFGGAGAANAQAPSAQAAAQKPNILVIMGDDIDLNNVRAFGRGVVGYRTPNIDRIANEGALFTDYYGQQCASRASSARDSRVNR